jgi:hypothetical protein
MSSDNRSIWETALLILYCAMGVVICSGLALAFSSLGLADYMRGDAQAGFFGIWSSMTFLVIAAAGLPALIVGSFSLWQRRSPRPRNLSRAWIASILVFPLGLALGYWIYVSHGGPPLFGTLAQVLALGSPILAMAVLVQLAGQSITAVRAWGHFLLGLWLIPALAFVIELILLIVGVVVLLGGLMATPAGQQLLNQLQGPPGRLFTQPPPEVITQAVSQPWILILAVLFVSVLIPMVEEGLKSIAIWPVLPHKPSPSQAFVGGALGGLGFALVEGMFLTQPDTTWYSTAFIRGGASMMHALAAGITAWGLAEAIVRRRIWRLPLAYLTAIGLHGMWNLSAIGLSVAQLSSEFSASSVSFPPQHFLALAGGTALGVLSLLALGGLPLTARRLARATALGTADRPASPDTPTR